MMSLLSELPEPGPLKPDTLRITPLGGLGEIGRNMTVFEINSKLLIVDCGVLFPEEQQPGVDLILPDFTAIEDRLDDVVGMLLTHGHEDHIGAVPYLLKLRPDIPIYGSELTLAFVKPKLDEHRIANPNLNVVEDGQKVDLGEFSFEVVAVTHSIPDALAGMIRTRAGNVLITGDFKMDQLPLDGRLTDLRAFARFGEEGVDLFMVDSTNAEVPGFVTPEREIGPVLNRVVAASTGQIVVASFASHVHRVQQVFAAAQLSGRKVALIGRSMERNMRIAQELGYLEIPQDVLVSQREAAQLPANERLYMATGSQGEPMAALARIANGEHRTVEVGEGDTVIFASSLIPGNENSVYRVINGLMRLGAQVVHQANAKVHVSGHAAAGELLYCYNIVQPQNVMPIHGEVRHLVANGELAEKTGVDPRGIILAQDGVAVDLANGRAQIAGLQPCEYVYVDGDSIGEISEEELQDRLVLGSEGFIAIYAVVDLEMERIMSGPTVRAVGLAESPQVYEQIQPDLEDALAAAVAKKGATAYSCQQAMRRVMGRWAARKLRRRPMIVPVVVVEE
ncbi:ribonuclease J [Gleimia hominis]|uniref:ribonuclease J n=1 Tax=Gleimia hominis TaxID=595468 RepID=UPI000C7FD7BE|nr:ribonuclease J [Gleimia hominis]WIK64929.1 ribonuclease J [Gleimia hominis]